MMRSGDSGLDRVDVGEAQDVDVVAVELGVDERAEVGVDSGENFGELLDLGDRQAGGRECLGHLEPDVSGPDDYRAPNLAVLQGAHEREGVAHRVQEMYPLVGAEAVKPGDGWSDRQRAGGDDQRV